MCCPIINLQIQSCSSMTSSGWKGRPALTLLSPIFSVSVLPQTQQPCRRRPVAITLIWTWFLTEANGMWIQSKFIMTTSWATRARIESSAWAALHNCKEKCKGGLSWEGWLCGSSAVPSYPCCKANGGNILQYNKVSFAYFLWLISNRVWLFK